MSIVDSAEPMVSLPGKVYNKGDVHTCRLSSNVLGKLTTGRHTSITTGNRSLLTTVILYKIINIAIHHEDT